MVFIHLDFETYHRYYNSWIETSDEPVPSDSSTATLTTTSTATSDMKTTPSTPSTQPNLHPLHQQPHNSLGIPDIVEDFAPAQVEGSIEWSVSGSRHVEQEEEESSSDEEEDVFGASFL